VSTNLSLRRRSNQIGLVLSILIGVIMGLFKLWHVDDAVYAFFAGTANFALGRWYENRQLREDGKLPPL
jgi:hypothetical protein